MYLGQNCTLYKTKTVPHSLYSKKLLKLYFPYIFALFPVIFPYRQCGKCEKINYTACFLLYHRYVDCVTKIIFI